MRLVRIGEAGDEVAAVMVRDGVVPVGDVVGDFDEAFFRSGALAGLGALVVEREQDGGVEPLAGRRFGAPIARPHQVLCIGLNYADHAAEAGQPAPDEPIVFSKSPNTVVGPDDDVVVPRGSTKTDWEVELGVVIGRPCSYLADEEEAAAAIAGYVLVNDVSERAWQLERGGQWIKGKSAPTFNPVGPWLVTPDELGDVADVALTLDVDDERRQDGSTATMLFSPAYVVHYLSQFMALEPGDLINTGTPPGVGMGMRPPVYLRGGERMILTGSGLGTQTQRVVTAD